MSFWPNGKTRLIFIGISLLLLNNLQALELRTFTLMSAMQYSVEHSLKLKPLAQQAIVAQLENRSALFKFFPSFDLTTTNGWQDNIPAKHTQPYSSNFMMSLTENIYDNGVTLTAKRIAQQQQDLAELDYKKNRDLICKQLSELYFRYSLASQNFSIQKNLYDLIKRQYQNVATQYYQGLKNQRDALRLKTQLGRAEINLNSAHNDWANAKIDLLTFLAIPLEQAEQYQFLVDEQKIDLAKITTSPPKINLHYDFQLATLQKNVNDLTVSYSWRKYFPEIYLTAALNYQTNDYLAKDWQTFTQNDSLNWNALVTLKYNIWDWGIRRRDVAVAQQKQLAQEAQLDQQVLNTQAEISKLMIGFAQSQKNYQISSELLELEQKNMNIIEADYKIGKVQYLDFVNALKDLADTKLKYFSALYELKQVYFSKLYHEGILYETIAQK